MEGLPSDPTQSQYLTFFIADGEYGVRIHRVKEIIRYDTVTYVPSTPRWIRGVLNLRGVVVPVVDLAIKFGIRETPITRHTCVVIVEATLKGERTLMGAVADQVSQVLDLPPKEIGAPPTFGPGVHVDYIVGMGRIGKRFVHILDIDRVLSASELLTASAVSSEDTQAAEEAKPAAPSEDAAT